MEYIILKAIHIIGIVSWFAGLFYLVRIFIYHAEAEANPEPKRSILTGQFKIMERRVWLAIIRPAMVVTTGAGLWLLKFHSISQSPWLHLKFGLLLLLFAYHGHCGWLRKQMAEDRFPLTSSQLRIHNEAPTFLLVTIVFTAISKSAITGLWALAGCGVFFGILIAFFLKKLQGKP